MADNWIDNLADEVHKQDAQELKDEQLRLHEAQVVSEKSRGLWQDLVLVVQRDILRFEKDFPDDPKRIMKYAEVTPTCFRLSRADHPSFSCHVDLLPENAKIEFKYVRTSGDDAPTSEWSGTLFMRVDSSDNLYLNQYGRDFRKLDDVSQLFLERVFTGS